MLWEYKPTQSSFRRNSLATFADSVDFRRYDDLRRHTGSSQNTSPAWTLLIACDEETIVFSITCATSLPWCQSIRYHDHALE
jgi:hypothetical protein